MYLQPDSEVFRNVVLLSSQFLTLDHGVAVPKDIVDLRMEKGTWCQVLGALQLFFSRLVVA